MSAGALLFVVVLAQTAPAAPPAAADPHDKAKAQALLKQGTALYGRGDFAGALDKFESAYHVYPSPKLQFNIGQANRDLGRPVEALRAFESFLALAPDAAADLLAEARASAAELRAKLGQLRVTGAPPGAEIAVDGAVVGTAPLAAPVWATPGRHDVAVRGGNNPPAVANVVAGGTATVSLALSPPALATPTTAATPTEDARTVPVVAAAPAARGGWWSRQRWYAWTAAGGAVVLAGAAVATGLHANAKFDELQRSCGATRCSEDQIDGVKKWDLVTNVLWGAAGLAAVGAGVSFYVGGRESGVDVAWRF